MSGTKGKIVRGPRTATTTGWLGRTADRLVSELSPVSAIKRQAARGLLAVGAGYDVTSRGYDRRTSTISGGGADVHQPDYTLRQLRELCHSHDRNGSVFSGMLDRAVDNVIGSEFRWEPETGDDALNDEVNAYIAERASASQADSRGVHGLVDQASLALRSMFTAGDELWAFGDDDCLHCYEADQLVSFRDRKSEREKSVVNGVEMDGRGRATGYWVSDRQFGGWVARSSDAHRIDASDCVWMANYKRRSQSRGIPALASPLALYERFDAFLDNETFAAEINSMLAFFIENDPAYTDMNTMRPGQTTEARADDTTRVLEQLERGSIVNIAKGKKVQPFSSVRPGSNFGPYTKSVLSMIGASIGMPLILVTMDFSEVNYSSARAALLEARRTFRRWQRFVRERMFLPVYRRWVGQAINRGQLPVKEKIFGVNVRFSGWEWVDPFKEVKADSAAVAAGFKSHTEVVEGRGGGRTFLEVCKERQRDEKTLREHGLVSRLDGIVAAPREDTPEKAEED